MSVETDFAAALDAAMDERLFPDVAPQATNVPYATYQVVAQVPFNALSGAANLYNTTIQLDIFAHAFSDAMTWKVAARAAVIAAFGDLAIELVTRHGYDAEPGLHRVSMDWQISHS